MKVAYLDCFAGASGDMCLGALLDAGLGLAQLKAEIGKLRLTHYDLQMKKVVKRGIGGSQALVLVESDHHHHRHLQHIEEIISTSGLADAVKQKSLEIFRRLAEAEAKVHQIPIDQVHFHEVGAMDAIIDVVGTVSGLACLGIEKVYCSPLQVGTGTVTCAHGILPVPAPATAELIRGVPVYSSGVAGELLTPTGAALLTTLSSGFGPLPAMTVERIGYGAGTTEPAIPNLLRVIIGEVREEVSGFETEQAAVIETNIDDMNPQMYDYLIEKMLNLGALDVFLSPVQMKKNRPGTLLSVICAPEMTKKFSNFIIRETTTIGLRWRLDNRIKARRSMREIQTIYGLIRFKIAETGNGSLQAFPEYEDCKRVALEKKVPLLEVMEEVRATAARSSFLKE
jgi:uncharacterized protein (TIGR00299 family) protein